MQSSSVHVSARSGPLPQLIFLVHPWENRRTTLCMRVQAAATEQEQAELHLKVDLRAGCPEAAGQAQIRTLILQQLN